MRLPISHLVVTLVVSRTVFEISTLKARKTREIGLLCGEKCMILTPTVFDWSTSVTDGR